MAEITVLEAQYFAKHKAHPREVKNPLDRRGCLSRRSIPEVRWSLGKAGGFFVESLRKTLRSTDMGEKRARDIDQGLPFIVMAFDGHQRTPFGLGHEVGQGHGKEPRRGRGVARADRGFFAGELLRNPTLPGP